MFSFIKLFILFKSDDINKRLAALKAQFVFVQSIILMLWLIIPIGYLFYSNQYSNLSLTSVSLVMGQDWVIRDYESDILDLQQKNYTINDRFLEFKNSNNYYDLNRIFHTFQDNLRESQYLNYQEISNYDEYNEKIALSELEIDLKKELDELLEKKNNKINKRETEKQNELLKYNMYYFILLTIISVIMFLMAVRLWWIKYKITLLEEKCKLWK